MIKEEMISGPAGRIEARYSFTNKKNAPIALVLHPHPKHGGTMHNKVTYTLFQSFVSMGFHVLRFNFRGVGYSEGTFSNGDGELHDAAACLNWLHDRNPEPSRCWVAGFSFGSWIAMQLLMRRPEFNGFIAISPPANLYDFNFLAPCPVSGLMIQGDQDTIVPKDCVSRLASCLSLQKGIAINFQLLQGADHFFTNNLKTIQDLTKSYVGSTLQNQAPIHAKKTASL